MKRYEIVRDENAEEPEILTRITYSKRSRYVLGNTTDAPSAESIVIPVFVYVHSGAMIRAAHSFYELGPPFTDRFDAGYSGMAWIDREQARKCLGVKKLTVKDRRKLEEIIKNDVKTFQSWLEGECYGFKIFDGEDEIDSCYGFYGYDDAVNAAKELI